MKIVNNQYENRHIIKWAMHTEWIRAVQIIKQPNFIFLVLFECFMRVYASKNTQISFNLFHNWYVVLFVLPENLVTILQQSTQLSITIIKKCAPSPIKLTGIDRPILLIIRSLYTDYVSLSILFFFSLTPTYSLHPPRTFHLRFMAIASKSSGPDANKVPFIISIVSFVNIKKIRRKNVKLTDSSASKAREPERNLVLH